MGKNNKKSSQKLFKDSNKLFYNPLNKQSNKPSLSIIHILIVIIVSISIISMLCSFSINTAFAANSVNGINNNDIGNNSPDINGIIDNKNSNWDNIGDNIWYNKMDNNFSNNNNIISSITIFSSISPISPILANIFYIINSVGGLEAIGESIGIDFNGANNNGVGNNLPNGLKNLKKLGNMAEGDVYISGPYGNNSSSCKVAFIVGVHPKENQSHVGAVNALSNDSSGINTFFNTNNSNKSNLNYQYYIYHVIVNESIDNSSSSISSHKLDNGSLEDYNNGRLSGQLLANKFAIPDIISKKFDLTVDVHSNQGNYSEKTFIFTALPNKKSQLISDYLVSSCDFLVYYIPPRSNEPTSAPYISEPLINNGIPTIVYETYRFESIDETNNKAREFLNVIDSYSF
ncbi:MAG: hypothetical protein ACRCVG_00510 [Methanobacteriaceae archaeon]